MPARHWQLARPNEARRTGKPDTGFEPVEAGFQNGDASVERASRASRRTKNAAGEEQLSYLCDGEVMYARSKGRAEQEPISPIHAGPIDRAARNLEPAHRYAVECPRNAGISSERLAACQGVRPTDSEQNPLVCRSLPSTCRRPERINPAHSYAAGSGQTRLTGHTNGHGELQSEIQWCEMTDA